MKKKVLLLLISIMSVLCLCSCEMPGSGISDYLTAPKQSDAAGKIAEDIKEMLGKDYTLVSPSSGNYRNTINFLDYDNDGENEAVVTYKTSAKSGAIHLLLLKNNGKKWVSLYNIEGEGTGVDFFTLCDLSGDSKKELAVGFLMQSSENKGLSIYSLNQDNTAFSETYVIKYSALSIKEPTENADSDIFIMSLDKTSKTAGAKIIGRGSDGNLKVISECESDGSIAGYGTIYDSFAGKDSRAFYICENIDNTTISAEIIGYNDGKLTNHTFSGGKSVYDEYLKRVSDVYVQDIDGDGIVEIPKALSSNIAQNIITNAGGDNIRLAQWYNFENGKFSHKFYTLLNMTKRYYIVIPDTKIGHIFAKSENTVSAITFFYKGATGEEIKLFGIYDFSLSQWKEKERQGTYKLLKNTNDRVFAVNFYEVSDPTAAALMPTYETLLSEFNLLSVKQR